MQHFIVLITFVYLSAPVAEKAIVDVWWIGKLLQDLKLVAFGAVFRCYFVTVLYYVEFK